MLSIYMISSLIFPCGHEPSAAQQRRHHSKTILRRGTSDAWKVAPRRQSRVANSAATLLALVYTCTPVLGTFMQALRFELERSRQAGARSNSGQNVEPTVDKMHDRHFCTSIGPSMVCPGETMIDKGLEHVR